MAQRAYTHSAYWYAKKYGWTHSDKTTYTGRYLDFVDCSYRFGNGRSIYDPEPVFNPLIFATYLAADIGIAVRKVSETFTDPVKRDRIRRELLRDLRIVRRPFYYARETARRRQLAAERRKVTRRTTTAPMPTPKVLLDAWNRRKESKERMILLGGMLQDLECYVDCALRFDGNGNVVGRNGGIRGWLREFLPELSPKYKTLMRYKAMAIKLRQATGTQDPTPTSNLLNEPRHQVVQELLEDFRTTFSFVEESVKRWVDPRQVFLEDAPVRKKRDSPHLMASSPNEAITLTQSTERIPPPLSKNVYKRDTITCKTGHNKTCT